MATLQIFDQQTHFKATKKLTSTISNTQSILPPFSENLPIDPMLKLSREYIEQSIEVSVGNEGLKPIEQLKTTPNYPTPFIFAKLASAAYIDYQQNENEWDYEKRLELPNGWELLTTATNTQLTNGYFAAAFWHPEHHHVIIAHRGTKPTTFGADLADIKGVVFSNYVAQMSSAATLAERITKALSKLNKKLGVEFQLFFTGHSLGGWLAQVTTFTTEYLHQKGHFFQKSQQSSQYHAHTVVFDSPGCATMLSQMREHFDVRYSGRSIDLAALDITSYLSAPNRINTCNTHVGTVYRLFTGLSDTYWYEKSTPLYNLVAHSMERILQVFDPVTGQVRRDKSGHIKVREVVDWPISGSLKRGEEYKNFFQWANSLNDYHLDPVNQISEFKLKTESAHYLIRYQTKPFDETSCPKSVLTLTECQFLEHYRWLNILPELFKPQEMFDKSDDTSQERLQNFIITENCIQFSTAESMQKFVPYVKRLLRLFPEVSTKAANILSSREVIRLVYQTETRNYLKEINQTPLDFETDSLGLEKFLNDGKKKILLQKVKEDTSLALTWTYKVFERMKQKTSFAEEKQFTALKLKRLLAIQEMTADIQRLFTDSAHLLIIECKPLDYTSKKLLKILFSVIKIKQNIKLILITQWNAETDKWLHKHITADIYDSTEFPQLSWKDLTLASQKTLLDKRVQIQGKSIAVGELLTSEQLNQHQHDTLAITQLAKVRDDSFAIGNEPPRLSDLPAAYMQRLENIEPATLLNVLINADISKTLFVINGLESSSPEKLMEYLVVTENARMQELLIARLGEQVTEGKNIIVIPGDYSEHQFKNFCHDHFTKKIQWLSVNSRKEWRWEQLYDPEFYVPRQLKKVSVSPIEEIVKNRLLRENISEKFVVSWLSCKKEDILKLLQITDADEAEKQRIRELVTIKQTHEEADSEFERLAIQSPSQVIHCLEVTKDNSHLVWQRSYYPRDSAHSVDSTDEFAMLRNEQVAVIVDKPGIGKSTTLTRLTEKEIDSTWIIRLNLKECQQRLAQFPEQSPTFQEVATFLWEAAGNQAEDTLGKWLFQNHLQSSSRDIARPLLILLDGFDELGRLQQIKVTTLLRFFQHELTNSGHQVVVTTRRHPQLEQSIFMLYIVELEEFNPEQQKQFLKDYWFRYGELLINDPKTITGTVNSYASALLKRASSLLNTPQQQFIGIPLQVRLLAEAFQDEFLRFASSSVEVSLTFEAINLATIYQRFINAKYKIYFKEKSRLADVLTPVQESWITEKLTKSFRRLGFREIFPEEIPSFLSAKLPEDEELTELYRVGLVQQDKFYQLEFVHKSFAEYFVADLISSWLHKMSGHYSNVEELLLTRILIAPSCNMIRLFLNDKLLNEPDLFLKQLVKIWLEKKSLCINDAHQTALHVASQSNQLSITSFLLKSFAGNTEQLLSLLTTRDFNRKTPLYTAVEKHHDGIVYEILNSVKTHSKAFKQRLLLATAFRTSADKDNSVVHRLIGIIERDIDMAEIANEMNDKWPLIKDFLELVEQGNINKVNEMFTLLDSENIQDYLILASNEHYENALHLAARAGYLDIVNWLLDKGADINVRDRNSQDIDNWTPLHLAAQGGHLEIVKTLVSRGAEINSIDRSGATALLRAVKAGHLEVVKYLITEKHADLTITDKSDIGVVSWASRNGHIGILAFLLTQGANIQETDKHRMTPLHHALKKGQWETVKYLINQGANINARDNHRKTVLQLTLDSGNKERVKYLVDQRAEVGSLPNELQEKLLKIVIGDKVDEKAFYSTIRSSNPELLDIFINKHLGDYKDNPNSKEILERLLSHAYEKLMITNVPLSPEIVLSVRDKLATLRFFSEKTEKIPLKKKSYVGVMERIEMVVEQTNKLCQEYMDTKEVDGTFMVVARFIAHNIRFLKRHLKSTYNVLPWEEIEFCMASFMASNTRHRRNLVNQIVLDKRRLLQHLQQFSNELNKKKSTITLSDINSSLPKSGDGKSARQLAIESVLSNNVQFQRLYDDHEKVRTVYSLKRIELYIKTVLSIDLNSDEPEVVKLIFERTLQVIGESLKNSLESPNLSNEVLEFLLRSAPKNLREILTAVRDSLSHGCTFGEKANFEYSQTFFEDMKNDLKKINEEIGYILYNRKLAAIRELFEKVISSPDVDTVKYLLSGIEGLELKEIDSEMNHPKELFKINELLQRLKKKIDNPTKEQQIEFDRIDDLVISQFERLETIKLDYVSEHETVNSFINIVKYLADLKIIKSLTRAYLYELKPEMEKHNLDSVIQSVFNIQTLDHMNFEQSTNIDRIKDVKKIFYDIFTTVKFSANQIKEIESFNSKFRSNESHDNGTLQKQVNAILSSIMEQIKDESEKKKFKVFLDENLHIYDAKLELSSIESKESHNKQRYDKLVTDLKVNKKKKKILRNYIENDKWGELKQEMEGIRNSYHTLLNSVKNAIETSSENNVIKAFQEFTKFPEELVNTAIYGMKPNLKNKLEKLHKLLSSYDHNSNSKLQTAIEMLMLDITDLLSQASLLAENTLFFEHYPPILLGKSLRNYLAHGDLLIDNFIDTKKEIISNAVQLDKLGIDFIERKDKIIGQKIEENINRMQESYNKELRLINQVDKMLEMTRKGKMNEVNRYIYDYDYITDVKVRDIRDQTVLHYAILSNNVEIYKFFSKRGVTAESPIETSIKVRSNSIFNYLIKNFIGNPNKLLLLAVKHGNQEAVETLVNYKNVDVKMIKNSLTLLHWVASNGHTGIAELLIRKRVDINSEDVNKRTPLHIAARNGHVKVAELLIDNRCNVNALDKNNLTPLLIAAFNGYTEITELLINNSADVNTASKDKNSTPLHVSALNGHTAVAELLIYKGANVNAISKDDWTPLHMAALNGHSRIVELLIDKGADVNLANKDNHRTPLHIAAQNGHTRVVELLIEKGADVNLVSKENWTPLHMAAQNGHSRSIELLIDKGADVNLVTKDSNQTPLHIAAQNGHTRVVELLVEKGADVNLVSKDKNWTPLHMAAQDGHSSVVKLLIDKGANVNALDITNITPLHFVAFGGNTEVATLLIDKRANVNAKDEDSWTPLHIATQNDQYLIAKLLIGRGADVNAKNKVNETPLYLAAQNGHNAIVKLLIDKGADVNAASKYNDWTSLHMAAQNGHTEVVQLLINKGADVNAVNKDQNWTPLHIAVQHGHIGVVELLMNKGADVNAESKDKNWTPLHIAARGGHSRIVELLIDKGANVNVVSKHKSWTPLHIAARDGHSRVVELLIDRKADVNARNEDHVTPLYVAASVDNTEVAELLLRKGAESNAKDSGDWTPLHIATQNGHTNSVSLLIKYDSEINSIDINYWTPLHVAAQNGHTKVAELLINEGANVNAQDIGDATPLHIAAFYGHATVTELLISKGAFVNEKDKDNYVPLLVAAEHSYWEVAATLLMYGADIKVMKMEQCILLKEYLEKNPMEKKELLLQQIELRLSILFMQKIVEQAEEISMEAYDTGSGCSSRRRRDLRGCEGGREREYEVFPYNPLEFLVAEEQHQTSQLYGELALAIAWQRGEPADEWILYQRYLGDLLEEEEVNHSPREQGLLRDHYYQAIQFFEHNPKTALLKTVPNDFAPVPGESIWLQNGQQSWLVFNTGERYKLYSSDFNYRIQFHTRPRISWSELSRFMETFFLWKSGSAEYHSLTLQSPLSELVVSQLGNSRYWQPDKMISDRLLLENKPWGLIDGVPTSVIRELFRVNGQAVDVDGLHSDFFQQSGIQLRWDKLHRLLPELSESQNRNLVRLINRGQWLTDSAVFAHCSADEQLVLTDYKQRVMAEFKQAETLTSQRLSELSWESLQQALEQQPELSAELKKPVLDNLKSMQVAANRRAWAKGMATQSLFFLPEMVRAANTGQAKGLAGTAGMLAVDGGVNKLYSHLLERLAPTLTETRLRVLEKLPVTSPVFKALTIYSIVGLTQQLQGLPKDSYLRQTIKHRLEEQSITVGLMVAELLGFEVTPLWLGLMAEQLIFESFAFRNENQLDIPFWEAFIMSLGFEQTKLQHILDERNLLDRNLAMLDSLKVKEAFLYGWLLIKLPLLGSRKWSKIMESDVPDSIREKIQLQPSPFSFKVAEEVKELEGFRQVRRFAVNLLPADNVVVTTRGKLLNTQWEQGIYPAKIATTQIQLVHSLHNICQEDNIFLDHPSTFAYYRRIASVMREGSSFCPDATPINIQGPGLAALYVNNQTFSQNSTQRNLFLRFDPCEGDIMLQFHPSGLQQLEKLNQQNNPDYHTSPNSTYHLTIQVGHKVYPDSIHFPDSSGLLTVRDSSQRINTHYFIDYDTQPFRIRDNSKATEIAFTRTKVPGYQLQSDGPEIIQLYPPGNTSYFNTMWLKGHKKYLQLVLIQQRISKTLKLSADQVEVLSAHGLSAEESDIQLENKVARFAITVVGNLRITHGKTQLSMVGEENENCTVNFSKTPSLPYQIALPDLQPVLESLMRPTPQTYQFSTPKVFYQWRLGDDSVILQILGRYQGELTQLMLEQPRATLSRLTSTHYPRTLAVIHYNNHTLLDNRLTLQQVIPATQSANYRLQGRHNDSLGLQRLPQGNGLLFESSSTGTLLHVFPYDNFTLNEIDYKIIDHQLYATGAEDGVIDGQQLIRYRTNQGVGIRLATSFNRSKIAWNNHDTLLINQLQLHLLPAQTLIYFNHRAFPWRALQENIHHRQHHYRRLPRQIPGAASSGNRPLNFLQKVGRTLSTFLPRGRSYEKQSTGQTTREMGDQWLRSTDINGLLTWGIFFARKWTGYSPNEPIYCDEQIEDQIELLTHSSALIDAFIQTMLEQALACGIRPIVSNILKDSALHGHTKQVLQKKLTAGEWATIPEILYTQLVQPNLDQISLKTTPAQASRFSKRIQDAARQRFLQHEREWFLKGKFAISSPVSNFKTAATVNLLQAKSIKSPSEQLPSMAREQPLLRC